MGARNVPLAFLLFVLGGLLAAFAALAGRELLARAEQAKRRRDEAALLAAVLEAQAARVGGASSNPEIVPSASVIESRAMREPCAACSANVRLVAHDARVIDGDRLRVVRVACVVCARERMSYYRIEQARSSNA